MALRRPDPATWTLGAVGLGVTLALTAAFQPRPVLAAPPAKGPVLLVPRAASAVVLDGEVSEPAWKGALASTGVMASVDGRTMTDSTVRLAYGDGQLHLLFYAADNDIRASITEPDAPLWPEDFFRVTFTTPGDPRARVLTVSPLGTLTDARVRGDEVDTSWRSGARLGHDLDGTPNDPRDEDEEWVIEMSIPLASLGLRGVPGERIGFSARRCDTPKSERARRCAQWGESGGELTLLP